MHSPSPAGDAEAAPLPITMHGAPLQRGAQHGRAARGRIHEALDFYGQALREAGVTGARRAAVLRTVTEQIEGYDPDLLREMEGIARGSETSLADIVCLNARSELLRLADEGCTAVALLPSATATGHTLLGQNWDWHPSRRGSGVLLHITPDDGPALLTYTEAGTVGRCGLNGHGVGVVGNALEHQGGTRPGGVPVALVRRRILASASLDEAVATVRATPRGTSVNHLIASAEGSAISCESTVDDVFDVRAEDGVLQHANHFRAPEAGGLVDTGVERTPDTIPRDARMRELMLDSRPIAVADLQRAFADHEGFPNSICRHAEHVDLRTWTTVVSVVMDLDERRLWLAQGPVCEHAFTAHALRA